MKKLLFFIVLTVFIGQNDAISQWAVNGSNLSNTNSGNVGIGNNSPTTLLYVGKNMTEPSITVRNLGGSGGATYTMIDDVSGANWKFKATNTGGFKIRDNANALDVVTIEPNSFANAIYIKGTDNIGIGTANPDPSAAVDVTSVSKGFLPPRMTREQLQAIPAPAEGLIVYCTDCASDAEGRLALFMDGSWHSLNIHDCTASLASPAEGTSVPTFFDISWAWQAVPGAEGYRWNTTNDYSSSIDISAGLSHQEILLDPNTSYTRYVWAYNVCDVSEPTAITISTQDWSCGDAYQASHVAGNFAPVSKTVTYGTVTNVPGEPTKCWISQNLGSDHQADSVSDLTEASAGWYWMFDRPRGFQHDGTSMTPPDWPSYGDFTSHNWLPENDPCINLLSNGWRLPTSTEYENLQIAGGWTNWNGPWNSPLKFHAAGEISNTMLGVKLLYRGSQGFYWTSTTRTNAPGLGQLMGFSFDYLFVNALYKADGFSVRCVKE
jgi:hypothetical protein